MPVYEKRGSGTFYNEQAVFNLESRLGITTVLAKLLVNRSIYEPEEARIFLNPSQEHLNDPFLFRDMSKAVERIKKAVLATETITVFGDYDVDGLCAAAIMFLYLKSVNADVQVYIPNRHAEGYGLNSEAITKISNNGTTLIITVDCGITASDEVQLANSLGIDVIITDHHKCTASLPDAVAIISTTVDSENYPCKDLCGAGLALKLTQALGGLNTLLDFVDLAAIGTIADMVPLLGENRTIVALGLEKIKQKPNIGIETLMRVSGIEKQFINSGIISFTIAPRLNAAGRIELAMAAFDLLVSADAVNCLELAKKLDAQNSIRQQIEERILNEVRKKIDDCMNLSQQRILVIVGENWHKGVIGIVASKVVECYSRPCLLITNDESIGIGSARSIDNFDIYKALFEIKHLFIKFGGHAKAAGFSISKENIQQLICHLHNYASLFISDLMIVKKIKFDFPLNLNDITPQLVNDLKILAPYGIANPNPVFLFSKSEIDNIRYLGNSSNHVKFSFKTGQKIQDGIGFGMSDHVNLLADTGVIDVFAGLEENEWMGVTRIQLNVKSVKKTFENTYDTDSCLRVFGFKYFDVFLSTVGYNKMQSEVHRGKLSTESTFKHDLTLKKSGIGIEEVIRQSPAIRIEDLVTSIGKSFIGHLLLVMTQKGAEWLFSSVFSKLNSKESVVSFFNVMNVSSNSIVLSPDCSNIPTRHYSKIYILEGEENLYKSCFDKVDLESKLCIVKTDENAKIIRDAFFRFIRVEKGYFTDFYKFLKHQKKGRSIWKDMSALLEDFRQSSGIEANGFQVLLMIEIFQELGFVSLSSEYKYVKVDCMPNPRKRDLTESKLYQSYTGFVTNLDNTANGGNSKWI